MHGFLYDFLFSYSASYFFGSNIIDMSPENEAETGHAWIDFILSFQFFS